MKGYKVKESNLNKKVVNEINKIPGCDVRKRYAGPGRRGQSDIAGGVCIDGVCVMIELEGKVGDNKPTRLQAHWLARWKAKGAITGVYHSVEEALAIVKTGIKKKLRQMSNAN